MADQPTNGNHKPPVHVRRFERTAFPAQQTTLDDIIHKIKELGHSGSLTISFNNGRVGGTATFEREIKENK